MTEDPDPFRCIRCHLTAGPREFRCTCGGLLEVPLGPAARSVSRSLFDARRGAPLPDASGVWRFRELVHPTIGRIVSREEGNTPIYRHRDLDRFSGVRSLSAKHEGENPTGSFKDRGMTVAVSEAARLDAREVCCASTGNTASSLASYAALAGLACRVFVPKGQVSGAKLAQTIAYGAHVAEVEGNFDACMAQAEAHAGSGRAYLVNSLNPWRIEGQKTIIFELAQQRAWEMPDWIAFPAGNLGNASAFGKALVEAKELDLIDRLPKLLLVQAAGAAPFYRMWKAGARELTPELHPNTEATAIRIGNPVSWPKALAALSACGGDVEAVTDREIFEAKRTIDRAGIGCEPASAASLAGVRKHRAAGAIRPDEEVVCILTGHILKDARPPAAEPSPHGSARADGVGARETL